MLVVDSREDAELEVTLVRDFFRHTDAVVLVSPRQSYADLAALDRQGVRAVLVNRGEVGLGLPAVFLDNTSTMLSICGHLAGLGHRRVAYLAGPEASWHERVRRRAVLESESFGLEIEVVSAGGTIEAGYRAVPEAMKSCPTALICFNDLTAFGALSALAERGIAVPDDVSVTGFDDIEFSAYARPSLTTARAPKQQLGEYAWRLAEALIGGEQPAPLAPLRTELVIRDSTGPAR
jgi:LacI family transcriptional regulator